MPASVTKSVCGVTRVFNPLREKGISLERQLRNRSELNDKPGRQIK